MQITALGNPKLLERVAAGLMAIRNMFSQFDEDMNNVITREEFIKVTSFLSCWQCALDPPGLHVVLYTLTSTNCIVIVLFCRSTVKCLLMQHLSAQSVCSTTLTLATLDM